MSAELQRAYAAIFLAEFRKEITREERVARVVALRDSPHAAGMTFSQRNAIAVKATRDAIKIIDEVWFSPSKGRWQ